MYILGFILIFLEQIHLFYKLFILYPQVYFFFYLNHYNLLMEAFNLEFKLKKVLKVNFIVNL